MNIAGKTILVTGASQGLGRRLAVYFGRRGAKLIVAARNEANLKETARMVEQAGGTCSWHILDLRQPSSIEAMVSKIEAAGCAIDIVINNAADLTSRPFLETTFDEMEGLIRTNLVGTLQLTRLLAPSMVARRAGMIVNVSSLAGYKPNPTQTVYSISKTGVNGMSDALRRELRGTGVSVMNVGLPSVADEPGKVPVDEYARKLEHAIQNEKEELFLSPVTKWLMRLYRFFPALANLR